MYTPEVCIAGLAITRFAVCSRERYIKKLFSSRVIFARTHSVMKVTGNEPDTSHIQHPQSRYWTGLRDKKTYSTWPGGLGTGLCGGPDRVCCGPTSPQLAPCCYNSQRSTNAFYPLPYAEMPSKCRQCRQNAVNASPSSSTLRTFGFRSRKIKRQRCPIRKQKEATLNAGTALISCLLHHSFLA